MTYRLLLSVFFIALASDSFAQAAPADSSPNFIITVTSKDGTRIAAECAGVGPSLVIVHGGIGDRSRWRPLFPLLSSRFNVCAMDRRGHGESQSGSNYSLRKEFEDVVAVVNSRPGPVFVLGHSYGAVCALEAAFLTKKISKLILYEPPLQDLDHTAIADRMERMIRAGDREQALTIFLQEIVMVSPAEIAAMKVRVSWPGRVAGIDTQIREIRALSRYRFDAKHIATLKVPTLLLTGSKTASPQLKQAISGLMDALPNRSLVIFEGQEHNAMDNIPQEFADTVANFLLGKKGATSDTYRNQHKNACVSCRPTTRLDRSPGRVGMFLKMNGAAKVE